MDLNITVKKLGNNTKLSLSELKKDLYNFIGFCKNNTLTVILTWFFILLAYGMKVFYYSISLDTDRILIDYHEVFREWISIGRTGLIITKKLFGLVPFNPYAACLLMVCAMFVYSLTWSYLFSYLVNEHKGKSTCSSVFPIVFLTAPLFAEQFNFILQGFEVAFAVILCSLAAFFISRWVISSKNIIHLLLGIFCMGWSFASYQAIVSLYMSAAVACYILIYCRRKKENILSDKNFFKLAVVKYAITFIIAYLCVYIFNKIIFKIFHASPYLDNMVQWGKVGYRQGFLNILGYMKEVFIGSQPFYSKLYIIVFSALLIYALINLFSNSKDRILFFLAAVVFLLTPFLLSVYLGWYLIPRMQFSLQFVNAFGVYFLIWLLKDKKFQAIGIIVAMFIALNQGYTVSRLFYTDYMKYQSEVALANKISMRIDELNASNNANYPVVYVGRYHPANTPTQLRGEIIGYSFFECDREWTLMRTIGYTYVNPTQEQVDMGNKIAKDMPAWPNHDSVKLADNLIIVKLAD